MRAPRYRPDPYLLVDENEVVAYPQRRPQSDHTHRPVIRNLGRRFAILEGASVFAGAADHTLYTLARRLQKMSASEGTLLADQGEVGGSLYLIDSGLCQLAVRTADNQILPVAVLGPGDCFGESSLIGDEPYQFTVRAIKPTILYTLDRASLHEEVPPRSTMHRRIAKVAEQRRVMLERLISRGMTMASRHGASVVAIYSPKGGSGRTTLAVNLAATLGSRHPGEVLLLDLSLPYNHAALLTNLTPTSSLASAASVPDETFEQTIMGAVVHHPRGMAVLTAALRPYEADLINPNLVTRAMLVVGRTFRYVVVDLSTALSEVVLTAFDHSHRIVVVTPPEITALKDTAVLMDLLPTALHVPSSRTSVVLNHRSRSDLLDQKDVERAIGQGIDFEILHDGPKAEKAALAGEILALTDPASSLTKGAAALANFLESDRQKYANLAHAEHAQPDGGLALTRTA